ncbi:MAG: tyrosine-type recombinase/integrase [Chloroflexi bacterium]|nr:tyrosine-type recombinase/integrase [Chloroflexota bacterium]
MALSLEVAALLRRVRSPQMEQCLAAGIPWQDTLPAFGVLESTGENLTLRPIRPDLVSQRLHRIIKTRGLDGLRLHDLRHAHASYMLAQGVHPSMVTERLGRADVSMVLKVRAHVPPGFWEQAPICLK